jgi:hypothetical protein
VYILEGLGMEIVVTMYAPFGIYERIIALWYTYFIALLYILWSFGIYVLPV